MSLEDTAINSTNSRLFQFLRRGQSFSGREPNCCFLNTGKTRFANISAVSGLDFPDDGRGVAVVDWDQDGDLDLWINNRNGPQLRFMRNDVPVDNHYVALRLEGRTCNRDAIGARVELALVESTDLNQEEDQNRSVLNLAKRNDVPFSDSRPLTLIKTLRAGNGFLAQSSKWIHFGLGDSKRISKLIVRWPGGEAEEFTGVEPDARFRLVQGSGRAQPLDVPPRQLRLKPARLVDRKTTDKASIFLAEPVPLPTLSYQTFDGQSAQVSKEAEGTVLLNLWASWCAPCLNELRDLVDRQDELRAAGVKIVALSVDGLTDDGSNVENARQLLKRFSKLSFFTGMANTDLLNTLQITHDKIMEQLRPLPLPTSCLIDAQGRLTALYKGPVDVDTVLNDVARLDLDEYSRRQAAVPFPGRWLIRPGRNDFIPIAHRLIKSGQLDDAADFLMRNRSQLAEERRYADILLYAGNRFVLQERYNAAIPLFREAVNVEPDSAAAHFRLAVALQQTEQLDEAVAHYRRGLKIEPDAAGANFRLGSILNVQGELNQAILHYREGVRLRPNFAGGHFDFGLALKKAGKLEEAMAHFRQAAQIDVDLVDARFQLGVLLFNQGDSAGALPHFRERVRLTPEDLETQNNLAWILATNSDPKIRNGADAIERAEMVCKATHYKKPALLDTLAAAQAETGRFDEAVSTAQKALELARANQQTTLAAKFEQRLRLYQNRQPYRAE